MSADGNNSNQMDFEEEEEEASGDPSGAASQQQQHQQDQNSNVMSDEALRKLLKPCPTEQQVLDILRERYADLPTNSSTDGAAGDHSSNSSSNNNTGVEIIKALDSYDDVNYLVRINGTQFMVKIHNGVESRDLVNTLRRSGGDYYKAGGMSSVIHLQNAMMDLLAKHNVAVPIPQRPSVGGPTTAILDDATSNNDNEGKEEATHTNTNNVALNGGTQKSRTSSSNNNNASPPPVTLHQLPVVSETNSPCTLAVRVLTWVEGRPMSSVELLPMESLAASGRYLGKMDRTLDLFNPKTLMLMSQLPRNQQQQQHPAIASITAATAASSTAVSSSSSPSSSSCTTTLIDGNRFDASIMTAARRYHQWDQKHTADLRQFVHCIRDEKRKQLVLSVLDAFQETLIETGVATNQFRVGINHGDFNDGNIILDPDMNVAGVIDFGDSVESWRVLDVAVAMAYGMMSAYGKANRSISAAAAILRGYNSVYPLTAAERRHLVLLMACRLACSVTLGAYSYEQNPENKYLLFHAEPAWKSLELLWCYDTFQRAAVAKATNCVFDQACLYSNSREKIIVCYDLVFPDPGVADLLQSVRISSSSMSMLIEPPKKKAKIEQQKKPVMTFVTGNKNKLEEVKRILAVQQQCSDGSNDDDDPLPFQLTSQKMDLPELQGDPVTIARAKCIAAADKVQGPAITEDTSLCFNALKGLPGPYVRHFLDSLGLEGLIKMLTGYEDKTGYAQTIVGYCPGPGQEPAIFDGRTRGTIVDAPRGELDFGWDPIFEPEEGGGKTYGEMTKEEKDAISHRSRAFTQLRDFLR